MKQLISNRKALSNKGLALCLVVVIVVAMIAVSVLYSENLLFHTPAATTNNGNTGNTGNTGNNGNTGLSIANYGSHAMSTSGVSDFLGVTTTYSEATTGNTGYVVQWVSPSTKAILNPSGSNGTGTINIPQADDGYVYAVVEPQSASGLYVDPVTTVAKNGAFVQADPSTGAAASNFGPVFGNGVNYWYFSYDVNTAVPVYGGTAVPAYSFVVSLAPYGAITLNTPSAITSVGTASIDEWVAWQATFATVNHAFAITKIVLTVNTTTSTNKVSLDDMAVPWSNTVIPGSSFVATPSATTLGSTDYTYLISSGIVGAQYVQYTSASQNLLNFKTHVTCNYSSGDIIAYTLTIYGLNTDGKTIVTTATTVDISA